MKQEVKNQHYVPQFYLRKFGTGKKSGRSVYVFNKKILKISMQRIKDIANKEYFYDLDIENMGKLCSEENKQILEEVFGQIEIATSPILDSIINKIENAYKSNMKILTNENEITLEEREVFSKFLATQYTRTNSFRECIASIYEMPLEKVKEMSKEKEIETQISEKDKRRLHINFLLRNFIEKIPVNYFSKRRWIFNYNTTDKKLCTSDNPINIVQMRNFGPYGVGLATADFLVFPLTPKISLYMVHPSLSPELNTSSIEESYLSEIKSSQDIEELNLNQTYHCYNEIYSLDNDFERIKAACKNNENNIIKSPNERIG
ncbi:DUF4238 domain-containing protein [Fusobacterium ulcerans]|uniref:DUF4238 domain-containing protein n=1 Tax=Fusobacterium ulcerans TaxID=861 RepID=UPI0026EF609C|nr:DUF4238 domain-containing protein [Fusobacterium ulcerans]